MAQTMTGATTVGRVNRRFLLLALILASLSAVLAYVALQNTGGGTASTNEIPVVVAKVPIPAGTRITSDMLELRNLPTGAVGDQSVDNLAGLVGQVARYPIAANEQVLLTKVVNTTIASNDALSYVLKDGMRGEAVHVDIVSTAGGLVLPGDHVDVLWVPFKNAPSFLLLSDVEITAVSQKIVNVAPAAPGVQNQTGGPPNKAANGDRTRASDASPQPDAVTVTMMLTSDQSKALFCADQQAARSDGAIRLAVRSFGDHAPANVDAPPCPPLSLMQQFGLAP